MAVGNYFGWDDNVNYRTRPRYLDEQCMCQDVQNSLSIAFLASSDRYRTSLFVDIFDQMAAGGNFGLDDNVNYRTRQIYLDEQCMCA